MKKFLAGVGSVVAIFPATDYSNFVPKASANERIGGYWVKTGDQLRTAMSDYKKVSCDKETSNS